MCGPSGEEWTIRRAGSADSDDVARLYVELKAHHGKLQPQNPRYQVTDSKWKDTARRALENPDLTILVAERGDRVVGFVKLSLADKPWGISGEIETLVVERSSRGRGVGTGLLEAAEARAKEAGAVGLRVDVLLSNEDGRAFYERAGYAGFALRYGKPVVAG